MYFYNTKIRKDSKRKTCKKNKLGLFIRLKLIVFFIDVLLKSFRTNKKPTTKQSFVLNLNLLHLK